MINKALDTSITDLAERASASIGISEDIFRACRLLSQTNLREVLKQNVYGGALQHAKKLLAFDDVKREATACIASITSDAKDLLGDITACWGGLAKDLCSNICKALTSDVRQQLFGIVNTAIGQQIPGLVSLAETSIKDIVTAIKIEGLGSKLIFKHVMNLAFGFDLDSLQLKGILDMLGVVVPGLSSAISVFQVIEKI
eukprot:TRINITY_DN6542_c0_g1_i1.p2 TRINITY_DN6542_c0_g1~~TRINITY_DN6542_c0_g1_i1.p2  ORF type:complete len:199 (+),score=38.42 TRINITY_DN6542_c0_g1_i1:1396-1992(+)